MKKFIKAEVVPFADFVQYRGWKGARENGKSLLEGRDYMVKDGDVVEFKIGT
jgi:ribosome-binding ATPase